MKKDAYEYAYLREPKSFEVDQPPFPSFKVENDRVKAPLTEGQLPSKTGQPVTSFLLEDTLFAMPTGVLRRFYQKGSLHHLPFRTNPRFLGFTSIGSSLQLCISIGGFIWSDELSLEAKNYPCLGFFKIGKDDISIPIKAPHTIIYLENYDIKPIPKTMAHFGELAPYFIEYGDRPVYLIDVKKLTQKCKQALTENIGFFSKLRSGFKLN